MSENEEQEEWETRTVFQSHLSGFEFWDSQGLCFFTCAMKLIKVFTSQGFYDDQVN